MAGRLHLMIGSNWAARPPLSFLPAEARKLHESLLHPQPGQCDPALPGRSLLLDPTATQLDAVIEEAFAAAAAQEATLVLAFTGHGVTHGDDYYLLAADSPEEPDSRTAFLLGQRVKELFRRYPTIDGLLLLLDTCESGHAAQAAGREWVKVLQRTERRFELLTAAGDGPAFGGCFTKSLTYLIRTGSLAGTDRLGCAEVHGPVNEMCTDQQATHFAFTGATRGSGDLTLWLALNAATASRRTALDGSVLSSAATVAARFFQPTATFARLRELVKNGHSVVVTGPAGSGKTALLIALAQPRAWPRVHALWLGGSGQTVEQVATELSAQLTHTADGYTAAVQSYREHAPDSQWRRADAVERLLLGPLRLLGDPVRIAIDNPGTDTARRLTRHLVELPNVQLITTAYDAAELPDAVETLPTAPADREDVAGFAARRGLPANSVDEILRRTGGSWLPITLMADLVDGHQPASALTGLTGFYATALDRAMAGNFLGYDEFAAVLAVLAAAGGGSAVPFTVLRGASAQLGATDETWRLHEILSRLGELVTHGKAGNGEDHFGLSHRTIASYLQDQAADGFSPAEAHLALANAIKEVAPMAEHRPGDPLHEYAGRTEAEHLWQAGQHHEAYASLLARQSLVNGENLATWTSWVARIGRQLGDTHPLAFRAGGQHARALGSVGDHEQALELLRELVDDSGRTLGTDTPVTLELEDHLGYWTAQNGDKRAARDLYTELVPRCTSILGEDDPRTLTAQHHLAWTTAESGDPGSALALWDSVLTKRERVIGQRHVDTLRTRLNILVWTAKTAYPPPDHFSFTDLLTTVLDTFGEDHEEAITVGFFEASFRAKLGTPDNIRRALTSLADLLPRAERVLGFTSLWPSEIRRELAELPKRLAELERD